LILNFFFLLKKKKKKKFYNTGPKVDLISKTSLPINSQIKMAVSVEQWAGSNKRCYPSNDLSPPILLTYSDDGHIMYWQVNVKYDGNNLDANKELWLKEVIYDIGTEEPMLIKCGPQGRAAIGMKILLYFTI
jgi:hypothetical protein